MAEEIYRNLESGKGSVHLTEWPEYDEDMIDDELEEMMQEARTLTGLGRKARSKAGIKVRQPLRNLFVKAKREVPELPDELLELLREELNVKEIRFESDFEKYYSPVVNPDFSEIGPKYETDAQLVGDLIKQGSDEAIATGINEDGKYEIDSDNHNFTISKSDVDITYEPGEDFMEVEDRSYTLLLDLSLDKELKEEGYVRELIRRIQQLRKEAGFEVTDRIELFFHADNTINKAIERHSDYLKSETLAKEIRLDELPEGLDISKTESLNGQEATIGLKRIRST